MAEVTIPTEKAKVDETLIQRESKGSSKRLGSSKVTRNSSVQVLLSSSEKM